MTEPVVGGKQPLRLWLGVIALLLGFAGVIFAGQYAWNRYNERYVVERTDDGAAITKIVSARFAGASALKVGTLSGMVQSTASDVSAFGMLHSDKVVKAPFSVDYFIDVSKLGQGDLAWDSASRTLVVDVPDVTVGAANVDEAARTISETRGLFVTREAADRMAQVISQRAQATAATEARKPERLALARDNARKALGKLLGGPLAAAGYGDVRVVLAFPWEGRRSPEQWDRSRNLDQVRSNQF
jgi:hypothetical protein